MGSCFGCFLPPPPDNCPDLSSTPSHSLNSVIHSIRQYVGNENPTRRIDFLSKFIDSMQFKIKASSEKLESSTSSSGIQLESVGWSTRAASDIIDSIIREANELENLEELGGLFLKAVKEMGESHCIFLGLSMAAYALQRCATVSECNDLLEKIVYLAKDVRKLGETIPHDSERLCYAVQVIVEGALLCIYMSSTQAKTSWYLYAPTMKAQLEKIGKRIQDITSSLTLSTVIDIKRQLSWRKERSPQNLLDFKPEGIEEKVATVKELVDLEGSEAVVALILWGFGGVGKSVLARRVIQELDCISKGFKFCMVKIDEKRLCRTSHIKQLQEDIIYDFGGGKLDLRDTEEGREEVQQVVRNKRCLLFIDNVVSAWYIKELLPREFLQSEENMGSVQATHEERLRIVITSRQNNIKHLLNIKKLNEYHVDPLSDTAAKIILRKTILGEGEHEGQLNGDFDEEGCINAIAEACKGVPLLLSVFGNYLRVERHQSFYEEAQMALTEGCFDRFDDEGDLSEKILFVYDKMRDPEAKEAFLDICTYFHGWSWEDVAAIVDSSNLEALHKRGLVKRDESGKVIVYEILRLLGSKVAKETRITNYNEFSAVIKDEYRLKNMKGLSLVEDTCLIRVESKYLNAMSCSLRVLMLGDWVVINGQCDGAFTNLRYLQIGDVTGFPFTDASEMERLKCFYYKSNTGVDLPQLPRTLKTIQYNVLCAGCNDSATLPLETLKNASFLHL